MLASSYSSLAKKGVALMAWNVADWSNAFRELSRLRIRLFIRLRISFSWTYEAIGIALKPTMLRISAKYYSRCTKPIPLLPS